MTVKGKYVVSSNGKVLAESENMITSNGLTVINQYLSNSIPSWAGSIAVGALSSVSTASSTTALQHEFLRIPVLLRTYRTVSGTNQIVLKATLDPTSVFQAYEIGVFPMTVNNQSFVDHYEVTDFSELYSGSSAWYIGSTPATTASSSPTPRIGTLAVRLPSGSTIFSPGASTTTAYSITTDSYTAQDCVSLLYYVSSSISSGSLTVYFGDDTASGANVWTASTTISSVASGAFYSSSLQFATKPTSFSNNVTSVSVQFAGSGTAYLDQMKIVTGDAKTNDYKLLSRTASATPIITKSYGQPMDIEYYLQVT